MVDSFRASAEPLQEVAIWMGRYREFLGESFDRLDAYLKDLQRPSGGEET
ncbi:hypothetical protein GCM10023085_51020 [Actinomadura viridis]|uniref:Uncharacterized protein n=1 Tax=Actinomadura viridis TaxID=58110 RepID=A0A931DTD2_9ACTN|nr:hypothetical protein [Actinomadura viridis]MBG6092318.1 hypothetical protein [Actinomadura viridis]